MGSSILASLSEAGGTDPFLPISGPLPPHGPVGADRVGTRPTHGHMQLGGPNCAWAVTSQVPIFNDLTHLLEKSDRHQPRSRTSSEPLSRIGVGVVSVTKIGFTLRWVLATRCPPRAH